MRRFQDKIFTSSQLTQILKSLRGRKRIVFTNGCFDLLHLGHITYLQSAKMLGDLLVVGVNSDASVSRLKGPERPIKDESQRSSILAALECVDYVVLFEEDTPQRIIDELLPDILVKGGDYQVDEVVGSEVVKQHGGQVEIIEFLPGYSTSGILKKINMK